MKKLVMGTLFAFLLLPGILFAQVKSYVCVVRQQYYSEHTDLLKSISKELKDEGYNTYSKAVDSYLDGGFGSGFVYVAPDGTNYIITNRHVVSQAATTSVEFEDDSTGAITKYENLKVVVTDDDIDIAILAFADGAKPFKSGLKFYEGNLSDGQEVWSAGFPGLGNDPIWQFGKGTVTNARARIKDLIDPEVSTIIQHSAQVDSGNSGGPLLVASGKDYLVAGINTWKAAYRDSTNFSIPASLIKTMLSRVNGEGAATVEDRAAKFAAALNKSDNDFTSIVNFISYHKAAIDGYTDFNSVLKFAPTSVRSYISDVFSYNPAEGLRYATAYQLYKKYGSTSSKTYAYKSEVKDSTDDSVSVAFTSGEDGEENHKAFETTWIKEHGLWRLDTNSKEEEAKDSKGEKNKSKKSEKKSGSGGGISFEGITTPETSIIKVDFELPLSGQPNVFGGEFQCFVSDYFGFGVAITQISNPLEKPKLGFGLSGIARVPLSFDKFILAPYAEVGYSMADIATFETQLSVSYEAGLSCTFDFGSTVYPGLGIAYRGRKFIPFMDKIFTGTTSSLLIYVSIGF